MHELVSLEGIPEGYFEIGPKNGPSLMNCHPEVVVHTIATCLEQTYSHRRRSRVHCGIQLPSKKSTENPTEKSH